MAKFFSAPERTFTRSQGCWNCVSYCNTELAQQNWATHKMRILANLAASMPLVRLGEQEKAVPGTADARLDQVRSMDKAIKLGVVGMCMKGGTTTDFVEHRYLCDKWSGRDGASVARGASKADLLPAELQERALERVKK